MDKTKHSIRKRCKANYIVMDRRFRTLEVKVYENQTERGFEELKNAIKKVEQRYEVYGVFCDESNDSESRQYAQILVYGVDPTAHSRTMCGFMKKDLGIKFIRNRDEELWDKNVATTGNFNSRLFRFMTEEGHTPDDIISNLKPNELKKKWEQFSSKKSSSRRKSMRCKKSKTAARSTKQSKQLLSGMETAGDSVYKLDVPDGTVIQLDVQGTAHLTIGIHRQQKRKLGN